MTGSPLRGTQGRHVTRLPSLRARFGESGVRDVGRLINREKLARAKQQRELRKQRILDEAGSIFARMAYSEVTLDTIGQRADVERGVTSMYFRSKENLFLIVFRNSLAEWYDSLEHTFRKEDTRWERPTLSAFLANSLATRPELTRYLSLLPVVLEQDIEPMEVFRFQRWRCDRMSGVGELMEKVSVGLEAGVGSHVLYRVQLVAAGLELACNPRGAAAFDRNDPDFAGLYLDMEQELAEVIRAYLTF